MASQGIAEMRNQARPLTAGSSATTRSKQAPWTELLYEVHTHLLSICNDITKNQRLCEGCDNLINCCFLLCFFSFIYFWLSGMCSLLTVFQSNLP
eukprot:m.122013 g.122013  ORF g.122013 m.122013 type:complete len:95 (+) comp15539_c0_seq2:239-523(+)